MQMKLVLFYYVNKLNRLVSFTTKKNYMFYYNLPTSTQPSQLKHPHHMNHCYRTFKICKKSYVRLIHHDKSIINIHKV